jgi:hypothetical protein
MRKSIYLIGAATLAVAATFVWSQNAFVSPRADSASTFRLSPAVAATPTTPAMSPFEMMADHNGPLPIEQWDAI